jgi:hypothetical protein
MTNDPSVQVCGGSNFPANGVLEPDGADQPTVIGEVTIIAIMCYSGRPAAGDEPLSKLRACCVSFNRAEVNEGWRLRSRGVQRLRGRQTARAAGETALTVHCLGQGCYHHAVKTFEELRLWERPQHRFASGGQTFRGPHSVIDSASEKLR